MPGDLPSLFSLTVGCFSNCLYWLWGHTCSPDAFSCPLLTNRSRCSIRGRQSSCEWCSYQTRHWIIHECVGFTLSHSGHLNFETNFNTLCKKVHRCLFCLRKLSRFNIDWIIMTTFYQDFIESVLSFAMVSWFSVWANNVGQDTFKSSIFPTAVFEMNKLKWH